MYIYDTLDKSIIKQRVLQFKNQTQRYLAGEIYEAEFLPLRLQNGLYVERNAAMLRIAIPYGCVSSNQLRCLANIARKYDKSFGHFTTRQNLQLNWLKLEQVPDILEQLYSVDMHAIQTSGNCIRSICSDHLAGVAHDEIADPRPWCEMLRQWATLNPEFAYLPRKFKFAINAASDDRAAIKLHDVGLQLCFNEAGEYGFKVWVGGGLGRTPMIAKLLHEFLPSEDLLNYVEAILRVYNRYGRRDNKYKARIKILVGALGIEEFKRQTEEEFTYIKNLSSSNYKDKFQRIIDNFTMPDYLSLDDEDDELNRQSKANCDFEFWLKQNVHKHKISGYASVTLSLKNKDQAPGDCTSKQMEYAANLADKYAFSELRVSHQQNLILPDVRQRDLYELWQEAKLYGFASANNGLLSDIICCPGATYCSLASAQSIPIAQSIAQIFSLDEQRKIGHISLNISGCVNACAHHHLGNIGILGLDKQGEERYQIVIGGQQGLGAKLAKSVGASFSADEVNNAIKKIIALYLQLRMDNELFIDTVQRVGLTPFKTCLYGNTKEENKNA